MKIKHASIVPLIGGLELAQQNVFGTRPEYILSYSAFKDNDNHLLNYYNHEVPYYLIDKVTPNLDYVDVVGTTCPCAGLSSLSPSASSHSNMNEWMYKSAEYVLENISPQVFWGENAPRLASKMGAPVVKRLRAIGEKYGYTFSIYKTKSILHGLSQVRDRTFYFFWKGDQIPFIDFIQRDYETIEDTIRNTEYKDDDLMSTTLTNTRIPSANPFYRYVLEEIEGGIDHSEFSKKIKRTTNPLDYIEHNQIPYSEVAIWLRARGYEREAAKAERMHAKLASGGNIMRKTTEIPKDFIGAFVGHMPTSLTHPDHDRYLTVREALSIMKMPNDYMLLNGVKNLNHICQNVPVTTAMDMASFIHKYFYESVEKVHAPFMIQCNKKHENYIEENHVDITQFV